MVALGLIGKRLRQLHPLSSFPFHLASPRWSKSRPVDTPKTREYSHIVSVVSQSFRDKRSLCEDVECTSTPGRVEPCRHPALCSLGGEIALPDQERLTGESLTGMGLPNPTSHRYNVNLQANTSPNSSKGVLRFCLGALRLADVASRISHNSRAVR